MIIKILKNWKRYLPIIGILLFIYILLKINLVNVLYEISQINIYFLILAIIFVFFLIFTATLKWFVIAYFQGIKIPFREAVKINLISDFYGFITPSKLGSVVRAEYLKEYADDNIGKGLFNFVIDKILDISSIIFIAILFSFIFKDKLELPIGIFLALFFLFVFLILFFIKKERSKIILRIFYWKFIPNKFREKAKITFDSFYDNVPKKRYFVLFFLLNLFNWFLIYLTTYFIGLSLGIDLPFIFYLGILPIGTLVTLIPISINGLGTREASLISLFGLFGISSAKVFSMSIIGQFIAGIIPAIIGIFLIFRKRLK